MLKQTITYVDYNDVERTETFYFNLSEAEVAEMEFSMPGGLTEFLQKIVAEQDQTRIMAMFKEFILKSYGEKSLDGKRFVKNQEIRDGFSQTEAYSILFMQLGTNAEAAAAFINSVVPQKK